MVPATKRQESLLKPDDGVGVGRRHARSSYEAAGIAVETIWLRVALGHPGASSSYEAAGIAVETVAMAAGSTVTLSSSYEAAGIAVETALAAARASKNAVFQLRSGRNRC